MRAREKTLDIGSDGTEVPIRYQNRNVKRWKIFIAYNGRTSKQAIGSYTGKARIVKVEKRNRRRPWSKKSFYIVEAEINLGMHTIWQKLENEDVPLFATMTDDEYYLSKFSLVKDGEVPYCVDATVQRQERYNFGYIVVNDNICALSDEIVGKIKVMVKPTSPRNRSCQPIQQQSS